MFIFTYVPILCVFSNVLLFPVKDVKVKHTLIYRVS